ncbi:hypothetical protein [Plantibacter sp. YIM 135249]|uniref:hypothetical protein n=1 Tax=Plantibacter sp. YIM 135249 TaxID=3423918 RepID=UPI003D338423
MRTRQRFPTVALTVVVMVVGLGLTGCVPPAPRPTSAPSETLTPVFASDEEALQVATETYRAYLVVSDAILRDGGLEPERLRTIATPELAAQEAEGYNDFAVQGRRLVGETKLLKSRLQSRSSSPDEHGTIATIYACVTLADVDVVDVQGQSVVTPGRPDERVLQVGIAMGIAMDSTVSQSYVVSDKVAWDDLSVCAQ